MSYRPRSPDFPPPPPEGSQPGWVPPLPQGQPPFLIDDSNIRDLVRKYLNNEPVPQELANIPIGDWDVSMVTNMEGLFAYGAGMRRRNFNEPLNNWNVSRVTNMKNMFKGRPNFNQPLNNWNVSRVTNMSAMFNGCSNFNQPLNSWRVNNVTNMAGMFKNCITFNQSLHNWWLGSLIDMRYMFDGCTSFNNQINIHVAGVRSMLGVFKGCTNFNNDSVMFWNVANVTNMESMFDDCRTFNQPIEMWNTENVTNMRLMFNMCWLFNQPLNDWNVSRVTNMEATFSQCSRFNQPLNNWNVSRVTDMTVMFSACISFNQNISNWQVQNVVRSNLMLSGTRLPPQFEPRFANNANLRVPAEVRPIVAPIDRFGPLPPQNQVDPMQIHRVSAKINYAKLLEFLHKKIGTTLPSRINYPEYINENMTNMINGSDETEEEKTQQRNGLQRIMAQRLNSVNYAEKSPVIRDSIFYTIEYVKLQPAEFKKIYVKTFVQECVTAYDGANGMTCAAGALERIVMSLVNPCQSLLSRGKENSDYETIVAIITANPNILIPEYIRDWYKIHKTGTAEAFPQGTTVEQKKMDLKRYLLEKLPDNEALIDTKIVEIADNIGYDADDFMYGGLTLKKYTFKKRGAKRKTKKHGSKRKTKKTTFKKRGSKHLGFTFSKGNRRAKK